MALSFFWTFGKQPPPAHDVALGFVPGIKPYAVLSAVGLIGAVIMVREWGAELFCCGVGGVDTVTCVPAQPCSDSAIDPPQIQRKKKKQQPHNIYLHSALVLSRKVNRRNPAHVRYGCDTGC